MIVDEANRCALSSAMRFDFCRVHTAEESTLAKAAALTTKK